MTGLETITFLGRLAQDPVDRNTTAGNYVVNFTVVRNKRVRDEKEIPIFRRVEAWQKLGEQCMARLRKGDMVYIEGEPKLNQWTDKEGVQHAEIVIECRNIQFLSTREKAA